MGIVTTAASKLKLTIIGKYDRKLQSEAKFANKTMRQSKFPA